MDKKHIVCFGDSNTWGYDVEKGRRFNETERWTSLLATNLGDNYLVIEEGLSGRTSGFDDPDDKCLNGFNYIRPCLLSAMPVDLLIIMLGTNDTKATFEATSKQIGKSLEKLVNKAKDTCCWKANPNILIVVPKCIGIENKDKFFGINSHFVSKELIKEYKTVALNTDSHYFDANEVIASTNNIDYIHLDAKGHKELADALVNIVKEIA